MSGGQWRSPATVLMLSLAVFMFSLPAPVHASTLVPTVGVWSDAYGSSDISDPSIAPNTTIIVDIIVTNAPSFNGYEYTLVFDPTYLQPTFLDVRSGIFTNPFIGAKDLTPGRIHLVVVNLGNPYPGGSGTLMQISFNVTGRGVSPLTLAAATTQPAAQSDSWTQLVLLTMEIPTTTSDGYFSNVAGKPGPVASFTFTPALPQKGQSVTFNATSSYDPDNNSTSSIVQYRWDFGDGQSLNATGPVVTHVYQRTEYPFNSYAGNFSARLTIVDSDNGFEGMVAHLVEILSPLPICHVGLLAAKVPEKCPTIQMAVNSVVNGGTIQVSPGSYLEDVVIQKPIILIGSGADVTVIEGSIRLVGAPNVTISGFKILNNLVEPFQTGLDLYFSPNAQISNNLIIGRSGSTTGVHVDSSINVTMTANTILKETVGIYLQSAPNSILRSNGMANNTFNFYVSGSYTQNIDQSNTVDGRPIFYGSVTDTSQIPKNPGFIGITDSHDLNILHPSITNEGQGVLVFNSTRIRIGSLNATRDVIGIEIVNSTSIVVANNTLGRGTNCIGVKFEFTSNSIVANNTIQCTQYNGVDLEHSSANLITHNKIAGGLFLAFSDNNTVIRNTVNYGTILSSSSHNSIARNHLAGSLELAYSTGNQISNNWFDGGTRYFSTGEFAIFNSPKNILSENLIANMSFYIESYHFDCPLITTPCEYLNDYVQDIGPSNSLGGRPIYYVVNRSNVRVPSEGNLVGIVNSTNILVQNASTQYSNVIVVVGSRNVMILNSNLTMPILAWKDQNLTIAKNTIKVDYGPIIGIRDSTLGTISGNLVVGLPTIGLSHGGRVVAAEAGISLINSTAYQIIGNYVTGLYFTGIDLRGSSENRIDRNTIVGSENFDGGSNGIRLMRFGFGTLLSTGNLLVGNTVAENYVGLIADAGNTIYENNFIQNVVQAESDPGNIWDNGAGRGNYWSDYTGQDTNGDGVGDTLLPYLGVDNYPLMSPWVPTGLTAKLTGRAAWPEVKRLSVSKLGSSKQTLYALANDAGTASEWVEATFNVTASNGSRFQLASQQVWLSSGSLTTFSVRFPTLPGSYKVTVTVRYSSDGYQVWLSSNSKTFAFQVVP